MSGRTRSLVLVLLTGTASVVLGWAALRLSQQGNAGIDYLVRNPTMSNGSGAAVQFMLAGAAGVVSVGCAVFCIGTALHAARGSGDRIR